MTRRASRPKAIAFDLARLRRATSLIGVDEAGRGALAGPVVAAAVAVRPAFLAARRSLPFLSAVTDSKKLSAAQRERVFGKACELAQAVPGDLQIAVGVGSVGEIDIHNILGATVLAMKRALEGVLNESDRRLLAEQGLGPLFCPHGGPEAPLILVDGLPLRGLGYRHEAVIEGDGKSFAIGLASVCAKVYRDRIMEAACQTEPAYGFDSHKGYGTKLHRAAILRAGPCPYHRLLFLRRLAELDTTGRLSKLEMP